MLWNVTGLGWRWAWKLALDCILEGSQWCSVENYLGTPGIWSGSCYLLIWSHCCCLGGNWYWGLICRIWKLGYIVPLYFLRYSSFDLIVGQGSGSGARGSKHWVKRTNLVDSRTSVTDVKFAPKTLGLLLATCNADGFIRIYEAPDIMNLSQWTLQHDINCRLSLSCLTWNPSLSRYYYGMYRK